MRSKLAFLLILWLTSFQAFSSPPKVVYRAVREDPRTVEQQGGFFPRGMDAAQSLPPPDTSLFHHAEGAPSGMANDSSGYVSTTTSLPLAQHWVSNMMGGSGFIYHIHPTGNFVDVNASLLRYSPFPHESEYSALGRVRWSQIVGWQEVRNGVRGRFVRNVDYNRSLYAYAHAGEAAPYLAGFPENHPAWNEEPWMQFASCSKSAFRAMSRVLSQEKCAPRDASSKAATQYYLKHDPLVMFIATE